MSPVKPVPNRLISLDALRGFTIIGMIIVNSPGSWGAVYAPLLHAPWHGGTPTDLVFPFFLFIMGVSITLALGRRLEAPAGQHLHRKILFRALKIFAIGILLNLWPSFDFSEIRVAGVLQRIAIVYAACAILFLHTNWKQQAGVLLGILLGYWAVMTFIPVPVDAVIAGALQDGTLLRSHGTLVEVHPRLISDGWIAANYQPGINFAAWLDRQLLPGRMYETTWDPEGLLSTLPSIATGLMGLLAGTLLHRIRDGYRKTTWLFLAGFACFVAGIAWSWQFPLNKNLWSSSFVLWSGGLAMLFLAAAILLVDLFGWRKGAWPGQVFGANAITTYALSGMLIPVFYGSLFGRPALNTFFMDLATGIGLPAELASLLYALLYTGIIFLPAWWLYRKKIFIRV